MERLINEILMGRRVITTECDYAPIVICRGLTGEEKAVSYLHYDKAMQEAVSLGLLTEDELKKNLEKTGAWTARHENQITKLEEIIEDLNSDLETLKFQATAKRAAVKKIEQFKEKLAEQQVLKSSLFANSAESHARELRYYWNMHNVIYTDGGKRLWDTFEDFEALDRDIACYMIQIYIKKFMVPAKEIRSLARNSVWRVYYKSCGNSRDLFNRALCDLDDNQLSLLYWSSFYESVFSMDEPPADEIIHNDTLFDAWVNTHNADQKKTRAQSSLSRGGSGKSGQHETFVMADDEGAKELYKKVGAPRLNAVKEAK